MTAGRVKKIIVYLLAVFWSFATIFPLLLTLMNSLKDNSGILLGMLSLPTELLWSNYWDAINEAHILRAIFNSLFLAITSTLLTIIVAMLAAFILSRKKFIGNKLIYTLFLLGVMVPVHCTIIPISSLATTVNGKNEFWYLILVYAAFAVPQAIFLFTGYLNGVDRELDDAARIDGCSDFKLLFKILFPVCIPIISTEAILAFISGYGELIFAMILMSDESKYTIARAMLTFSGSYQISYGPIFACIILAVIPMIILYLFFHEKVQNGMLTGALKG